MGGQRVLVWDYFTGDVIDAETGEVVDRIYVASPQRWSGPDVRVRREAPVRLSEETRAWLRLTGRVRGRGLVVSEEGFRTYVESGKRVKVFTKPVPSASPLVRKVLEEVVSKYPRLKCRTERYRFLAAEVLTLIAVHGRIPRGALGKLARKYGVKRQALSFFVCRLRKLPYFDLIVQEVREVIE